MKKLIALFSIYALINPFVALATFPTQSILFASASSQYATASDNAAWDTNTQYTLEAWMYLTNLPSAGTLRAVLNKDDGQPNRSVTFYFRETGTQTMGVLASQDGTNALSNNYQITGADIAAGTWKHYAWVLDIGGATEFETFIDGVSQGTSAISETGIFDSTADVEVGATKYGGAGVTNLYNGRVGLMRLWKEARTSAQLDANKCSILGATTNLVAEYTFDNVYTDNSGNSLTLTGVNSPTFASDVPNCYTPFTNNIIYGTWGAGTIATSP